jgi:hypothetical protein
MSSIQVETESLRASVKFKPKEGLTQPEVIYSKPYKAQIKQGQNTFMFEYECVD